jgi:Single-stranded DNA-specific exonuclease
LITNNLDELEKISKRLLLLNEKRKLIENHIFEEAFEEASKQNSKKIIIVSGFGWHTGVLGIIASRLTNEFNKPAIVISFNQKFGVGSARSIEGIDLGNIIIQAKEKGILIKGGGHKMAAGLKIKKTSLNEFNNFLVQHLDSYSNIYFVKKVLYDSIISIDEINLDFIENIEKLEPFGNDNEEPKFIIKDMDIKSFKIVNNKHIMIFSESALNGKIHAISFNSVDTSLGQNIINNKTAKYAFGCTIKKNNFNSKLEPQIIIKDAMVIN